MTTPSAQAPPPPSAAAPAHPARRRFLPILTQQPRVPWTWVVLIQMPWFVNIVVERLSGTMMTFTLRKFVELPILITLLTSFNIAFNMLVGATCNYLSDRVWTRFGRRRPFLIVASLVTFTFLLIIPVVGVFWLLVLLLFLYEMIRDIGSPTEPLEKEVVPPPQRGRGQAITQIVRTLAALFFSAVLLGRFDERYDVLGWSITGEMFIYWVGAVLALGSAIFYTFFVRELPPPQLEQRAPAPEQAASFDASSTLRYESAEAFEAPALNPRRPRWWQVPVDFLLSVFGSRHNWAIYVVGVVMTLFWTGLGNLAPLLITEQFGYSKQQLGYIESVGPFVTLLIFLPVGGWLVDRLDRNRIFVACAALMTLHHVAFYAYVRFLAPDGIPPIWVLMAFGIANAGIGNIGTMAAVAMQFDYMATSQMGTISAGIGITRTVFALVTANVIGLWVTMYSGWYGTPGSPDYLSGYHYLILFGVVCTAAAVWFVREDRTGRLVKYGVLEQQQRNADDAPAGTAPSPPPPPQPGA